METVLDTSGIRSADRHAIKKLGVPPAILMENAGRSVAGAVAEVLGGAAGKSVTVVCGKGNNGGDGFVAARHLLAAGAAIRVILLARESDLRGEPLRQYSILRRVASELGAGGRLTLKTAPTREGFGRGEHPSAIIDAIFGTGFHGKLGGSARRAVNRINQAGCPVISVDVPSGLNSDDGSVEDACVRADVCVTMGTLKTGHLIGSGPEFCGDLRIADLGVGMSQFISLKERVFRVERGDIPGAFPRRARQAHKHSVGKILILAGSVGFTGAAALAATAAMRSGAGAVVLGTPESVYPVLGKKLTEVMVKPLPESSRGTLCPASLGKVSNELGWADVILVGPGLGMTVEVRDLIENLLKMGNKRIVIDADALTHLAGDRPLQRHFKRNTCILTPHVGEFSRLSGYSAIQIEKGRVLLARKFARDRGVTLVLKGSPTVTAGADGSVYINPTGNPGMATAGMGDVLAGMISALWAGNGDDRKSAYSGVYLHGEAGDIVSGMMGQRPMIAGDLLRQIPEVFKSYQFI